MKNISKNVIAWLSVMLISFAFNNAQAETSSPLALDMGLLVEEARALDVQLSGISLTADNLCSELLKAHVSADSLIKNIEAVKAKLAAPLSIDVDTLDALDSLSATFVSLSSSSVSLSQVIAMLNSTSDMFAISNGISAMLRLSDDIGIMADRILEMADKILVMADNIGIMADRIITTQQIQSANLALTQASLLQTQQNVLALVSVVSSSGYDAEFDAQTLAGNVITMDISTTALSVFNMARKFAGIATDVEGLKGQIETTHRQVVDATRLNTIYIDVTTMSSLADMSIMMSSLSIALEGLSLAAQGLSPVTGDVTLSDSMNSMLQLSSDIGIMANRILEMADLILAMADNIGLTADQIISAQQLQSSNYASILGSVEAIQVIAVSVIAAQNL